MLRFSTSFFFSLLHFLTAIHILTAMTKLRRLFNFIICCYVILCVVECVVLVTLTPTESRGTLESEVTLPPVHPIALLERQAPGQKTCGNRLVCPDTSTCTTAQNHVGCCGSRGGCSIYTECRRGYIAAYDGTTRTAGWALSTIPTSVLSW